MKDWIPDKEWSDHLIPLIKRAIAPHVIDEGTVIEDQAENTDLIVLRASSMRIACRVRSLGYLQKYPFDITIRRSRPSGATTELEKIGQGFGDRFFYGHADSGRESPPTELLAWWFCDLDVFRKSNLDRLGRIKLNRDESSDFLCIDLRDVPGEFIIDSSGVPLPPANSTNYAGALRKVWGDVESGRGVLWLDIKRLADLRKGLSTDEELRVWRRILGSVDLPLDRKAPYALILSPRPWTAS